VQLFAAFVSCIGICIFGSQNKFDWKTSTDIGSSRGPCEIAEPLVMLHDVVSNCMQNDICCFLLSCENLHYSELAALRSRCGHYIFALWLLSSVFFFIPRLISAVADWMSTILLHMV